MAINDIHVYRGKTYVLQGISLRVDAGEIVALIGANGAGKTTLMKTVSGLLRPREGGIVYRSDPKSDTIPIQRLSPERIVQLGISHCPEGRGIFSRLSVRENLLVGAYLRKDTAGIRTDFDHVCRKFPILGQRREQMAGSLSGGEQAMLAVGRALMSRPKLLILDEPSLGLGPIIVENIFTILEEINARGVTILLVEQNAAMALNLAHRAYVLEAGRVTLAGSSRNLAVDDKVRSAYLGGVA